MCTACVSMRGLIYRSQGCLVSPTSTVNTVILNLHPAKGSKLRNNYACLLRRGRRTPKGCMENILYGFEPRYTPPTRFPSRQIILRFEGGGAGRREREREKGEEKVSLATIRSSSNIRKLGRIDRSFDKRQRIIGWWKLVLLSLHPEILRIFHGSKDWTCLRRPISPFGELVDDLFANTKCGKLVLTEELCHGRLWRGRARKRRNGGGAAHLLYLSICEAIFSG